MLHGGGSMTVYRWQRKEGRILCACVCVFVSWRSLSWLVDCNTFLNVAKLILVAATPCLCRSNRNSGRVDMQTANVLIVSFSCLTSERC